MPGKVSLTWHGLHQFRQSLQRYNGDTMRRAAGALYREGERIMTRSQQDFVPVDTGALRGSGFVKPPEIAGMSIVVVLGFGGAAAPYALTVHEDLQAQHTVGQAKYLQIPLNEAITGMDNRLAADIGSHGGV